MDQEEEKVEVDEERAETRAVQDEDPSETYVISNTTKKPESAQQESAPTASDEDAPPKVINTTPRHFSVSDWTNLLSVTIALGLTTTASFMCTFYSSSGLDLGLLVYEDDADTCKVWFNGDKNERQDDLIWDLVRWFVGIAVVWSVLVWFIFWFTACSCGMVATIFPYFGRLLVVLVMSIHVMCFLFLLSFTTQSSNLCWERDCTLEYAAYVLLAGVVAWWLAGATVLVNHHIPAALYVGEEAEVNEPRETTEPRFSMWKTWRKTYMWGVVASVLLAWAAYGIVAELKRRS